MSSARAEADRPPPDPALRELVRALARQAARADHADEAARRRMVRAEVRVPRETLPPRTGSG